MAGRRPRKLLFYTYALQIGGAERVCAQLASAFAERGDSVTLAVDVEAETDVPLSRNVRKIALGRDHARSLAALARLIRAEAPDVSLSALSASNLKHSIAAFRAGRAGRAVLSWHGYFDAEPQMLSRAGFIALPVIARLTGATVCVSDGLLAHVRRFGAPARKTRRIFNPVALAPMAEIAASDLAQRPPLVLAVGRLNPVKAFDTLIRAFARVATPGVRLRIVGEGPERANLARLIASLGLASRVELAGAASDVSAHYRAARCLALTSRSESFGNVVVEALSHGVPVVATDCGGPSEIIDGPECGLIAPVGDIEQIARAIDATLAAPGDPAPRLHRAAQFSIERSVAAYDDLFDDVIRAADGR